MKPDILFKKSLHLTTILNILKLYTKKFATHLGSGYICSSFDQN